ncbi:MAG: ATP-binding protein [Cyanobacteria bacterium P01_D01_bin.105]
MTALTPSNTNKDEAAEASFIKQIKALERANRILTKRLAKSERARADLENASQYQERMLRKSLSSAERDRVKLATAQEQLLKLNQELESRIEVRTAALDAATDSLEKAKVQVVKSEKFSALGELVAGVAHEINNPIGCITSNVAFAEEYGHQLMAHIELLQSVLAENLSGISAEAIQTVTENAEAIELDYIFEDFPNLIESIATSGNRIKAISQSLRTFARADILQKQPYDLHQGIDGTLLILRHRLKAVGNRPEITIAKNYGSIPSINCYPGQINQVFMNILANAIDAMDESHIPEEQIPEEQIIEKSVLDASKRKISITTALAEETVVVNITDTAGGIPDSVITRIFESQFTTKTADKGTGLGLSIAHEIVTQNHLGQIECSSEVGQGTTFTITLPVS